MIPISRIITILMFGAICFVLIVPLAVRAHNVVLAVGFPVLFIVYLVANIVLWRRMNPRS